MPYNPLQPLDFDTNPATLSEYLSHETDYETQTKPDTCRKDESPVASGTFEEAVRITAGQSVACERTAKVCVSGGDTTTGRSTGQQLTLF